jgi:fructoselysine 6-kinase
VAVGPVPLASIGDNCIDRYVPAIRPDTVGGNALNVAVGFVQAGHPTTYLGAVGDDAEGRLILEAAAAAGVGVEGVRVLPEASGVTTVELQSDGDRLFVDESYGASALYRLDRAGVERLRGSGWIHAANLGGAVEAVRQLASEHENLSYDFSDRGDRELRNALCPHLRVAFFSSPDGTEADAAALAEAALADGAAVAVVTRGAAGSLASGSEGVLVQEALPVEVVDTLGAGDAFLAAFVAALVAGAPVGEALERAAGAAARTCEIVGPWLLAEEVQA